MFETGYRGDGEEDSILLGFNHDRDLGPQVPFENYVAVVFTRVCNEYMRGLSSNDQRRVIRVFLQLTSGGYQVIKGCLEHFKVEAISKEDYYNIMVPLIGLMLDLDIRANEVNPEARKNFLHWLAVTAMTTEEHIPK